MYWTEIFAFCAIAMVVAFCVYLAGNMVCSITESQKKEAN